MRAITLLDTSISSDNLGDEIIMDAVREELQTIVPDAYLYTVATHDALGPRAHAILKQSEFAIAGGTNLLSGNVLRRTNWKIGLRDLGKLKNVVLMGVGWKGYQGVPKAHARFVYRQVLSSQYLHSARDGYSVNQIAAVGGQVVNTACPTMWRLTPEHCARIGTARNASVLTTLTYYLPNPQTDKATLDLLQKSYDKVYFWPQQFEDLAYLRSLGSYDFEIIDPSVAAYSQYFRETPTDYVGSRLHGGIRALQNLRRSLIVAVDNRAAEIGKDTNLPVVDRRDIDSIRQWIENPVPTRLSLPQAAIDQWRTQFRPHT